MKGDLVYEKLGEIDPGLIAEALPGAVPLYRLGGDDPLPPKKWLTLPRTLVICACLLLAGLLLVGGGIALSRSLEFPWETDTDETPTDQGKELTYQGTVTIDGLPPLTGSDDLAAMGDEIKARFSAATLLEDVCECERDLPIQIGEDALTYNRDHGCFRDGKTGKVYRLRDEDRAYMEELLVKCAPPVIMDYTHATLHHGDDYTCTVSLVKNEDFPNIYEIKDVYLRTTAEESDYRTGSFREIPDRDSFYCGSIPADAPLGDFELVVSLFSPYTGRSTELALTSPTAAVTVAAHEREPDYVFFYETDNMIVTRGDDIVLTVGMINKGDPIYRFTMDMGIRPNARLRTVVGGETVEYVLSSTVLIEWYGQYASIATDSRVTGEVYLSGWDHKDMPLGTYDLILSFEGHEQVFPNALAVTAPDETHAFQVDYSFFPKDGDGKEPVSSVAPNGMGYLSLRITHEGDTLYRYGYDDCLRPDSVKLYRHEEGSEGENAPLFYATHTEKTKTLWAWENGMTTTFLYEWNWETAPIEPGTYTLQVIYRGKDGSTLLELTREGILTVVAP